MCESVTERAYDTTRGAVAIGQHYEQTCILMIDMTDGSVPNPISAKHTHLSCDSHQLAKSQPPVFENGQKSSGKKYHLSVFYRGSKVDFLMNE